MRVFSPKRAKGQGSPIQPAPLLKTRDGLAGKHPQSGKATQDASATGDGQEPAEPPDSEVCELKSVTASRVITARVPAERTLATGPT